MTPRDNQTRSVLTRGNIRIEGPTVRGTFFLRTDDGNVFDGECWRGFGPAHDFSTFREAWTAVDVAVAIANRDAPQLIEGAGI